MATMSVYRTILAATFQHDTEHRQPYVLGDLIRLDLDCGHVRYGNPSMHYKVGSSYLCRACERGEPTTAALGLCVQDDDNGGTQ